MTSHSRFPFAELVPEMQAEIVSQLIPLDLAMLGLTCHRYWKEIGEKIFSSPTSLMKAAAASGYRELFSFLSGYFSLPPADPGSS